MTAVEILEASREALACVRRQRDVVQWLEDGGSEMFRDASPAEDARRLLHALEDRVLLLGDRAMAVLARLPPGREYGVLVRYYVLGDSLSQIAIAMACNIRTVTRAKIRGLRMAAEIEDDHAKDADYRQSHP